jgi:hypothetical protein
VSAVPISFPESDGSLTEVEPTYSVYRLENEWGEPFYVGCALRAWTRYRAHLNESGFNFRKDRIIAHMLDAKMRPAFIIIAHNLTKSAASAPVPWSTLVMVAAPAIMACRCRNGTTGRWTLAQS